MRKLAALALLLIPATVLADWKPVDQLNHYMACREAGGTPSLCDCAIKALQEIQPDVTKLTGDDIEAALKTCVLPPPQAGELRI
jgi:hypothetical protein